MKVLEFRLQGITAHPQNSYCKSEILFVMLHGSQAQADRKSADIAKCPCWITQWKKGAEAYVAGSQDTLKVLKNKQEE